MSRSDRMMSNCPGGEDSRRCFAMRSMSLLGLLEVMMMAL